LHSPKVSYGEELLQKTFLDLGFEGVTGLTDVFSVYQTRESPRGPCRGCTVGGVTSGAAVAFHRQGMENLIVYYEKSLNKFGNYGKIQDLCP
jgi:hypothetical protein